MTEQAILSSRSWGSSRFPLRVGSRVRNQVKPADGELRGGSRTLFTMDCALEINGEEKPALVVSGLGMAVESG